MADLGFVANVAELPQGNTGDFMGRQGDGEGQAEEDERRQLDQPGAAPGEGRKHVGQQGDNEQQQLFERVHLVPVRVSM